MSDSGNSVFYKTGNTADWITGYIPYTIDKPIYIKGLSFAMASHDRLYFFIDKTTRTNPAVGGTAFQTYFTVEQLDIDYYKLTPISSSGLNNATQYIMLGFTTGTPSEVIITVNEPIEYTTIEDGVIYHWENTGRTFVPSDCEDRIIALESENEQLKINLDNVEERIDKLENAETFSSTTDVVDYVQEEAERVAKNVYLHQNVNTFTFLVISDMHEHINNEQIMISNLHAGQGMNLIRKLVHVDFAVCLGDNGWGSAIEGSETRATIERAIAEIRSANAKIDLAFREIPNFRTLGNHCPIVQNYEFNNNDYLDENELFPLYGAYNTGAIYPNKEKDRGYCYRDFEDWKIRVICMNSSDLKGLGIASGTDAPIYTSGMQLKWFAELLDMSDKEDMSEWGILIFSHLPMDYSSSKDTVNILKAYLDGTTINLTKDDVVINYDYTGKNGAVVIANVHGHNHCYNVDNLYINADADSKIDVKRICIPNACFSRTNERGENGALDYGDIEYGDTISYEKTANTAQDTSFNVITIDPIKKMIYADNYGAGIDREISYNFKS